MSFNNNMKNIKLNEKMEVLEKNLHTFKKVYDSLEIKDQYIIQTLENCINLIKTLSETIENKAKNSKSMTADDINYILDTASNLLKEIRPFDEQIINKQVRKIHAIYNILKE